ncbi:hypothetical protein [Agromyces sp. SYSU T00194]|uniref:hypothetical protein n=1 Tax=Agromyces chitinivorans TaxID=3158560 RepID=UPI0033995074
MPSDSQRPRHHVAPRADSTFGDLAAKFAADYQLDPDGWQRLVLDDWLAMRRQKFASLTCGLAVPRQNGKNALLEVRELFGMVGRGEKILHTAHEVKTAQKHFRRLKFFFGQKRDDPGAKFPELNALVQNVRSVNGQEAIFLTNGGSIELVARSKNSGRGFTVDVLVMDEAQELSEDALEALMPTTSAAPLGNPQWIFTGTPPGPSAVGEVFTRVRHEALGDRPGRIAWHEWSVEGSVDLDDRRLWHETNPGIDAGRLQVDVIAGERARFSDAGFARERLGRWSSELGGSRLVTVAQWDDTGVKTPPASGVKSFGVAFSKDGTRVSVAGSVKHDGGVHVELVGAHSGPVDAGVASLADWLAERATDTAQIVISGRAGATVLQEALRKRRVSTRIVHVATTSEYLTAAAMLYDSILERSVTHLAIDGQKRLDDSISICDKENRTRDGGWGWKATTPDGDETPTEAISLANWAAVTGKRTNGKAVFV